ncbi:permease prefix domain 2-containing transporter [Dyadobacter sp. CY323]|uniref:permease prefix domain 2-containing transporter n=1 Tax=Dyadobacter sp. CY323 TaxID=2907302 RepID=UPI001F48D1BF|nr:permease prefix domain 2-containing transporter [Dyadobacter sp. CY323]MCE6992202.1 permease prefix domain 2-containing transporter [Dyadobacter sp. CY323]
MKKNILPPKWLDRLATKLCAPHLREELIGDLQERYAMRFERSGRQKAFFFYLREVFGLLRLSVIRRKSSGYSSIPLFSSEMLANYFKIGTRVLLKNRGYSFIHLTGLAIGLWACMIVATVVIDSLSYDRQWSRGNDIYRIVTEDQKGNSGPERMTASHEGLAQELEKLFPEVETWSAFSYAERHFKPNELDEYGLKTELLRMDTTAWNMLDIHVTSGNPRRYIPGNQNVILSKSFAERFAPGKDLVGKLIYDIPTYQDKANPYLVTGIIDDLPYNSHLRADAILLNVKNVAPYAVNGFYSFAQNYVMLHPGTDVAAFSKKANHWYTTINKDRGKMRLELQPLKYIYLHSAFSDAQRIKGNADAIYIFSGIALLLLFIACVNFINLSTAKAFARLKEAGVRRILSGSRYQLILQLLTETLILFGASIVVATTFYNLSIESVEEFLGHRLVQTFTTNPEMALYASAIVFLTALFTGLYPAWLISGFKPSNTLRGIITGTFGANSLRKSLVVVQFSISIVVLLATIVVWKQLDLMKNKDLGYDKKHLLGIDYVSWDGKADAFKAEVQRIPGVVRTSITRWLPSQGGGFMMRQVPDPADAEKRIKVWFVAGDVDLPETLGLKLSGGRTFSKQYSTDALNADSLQQADFMKFEQAAMSQASMLTESAAKMLNVKDLNKQIRNAHTIPVGIVSDFYNESLYEPIKPTIILAHRAMQDGGMLIRVQPGTEKQVDAGIHRLWKQFYPAKLLEVNQIEELLDKQYEAENRLHQLFMFFSGLTMFLSALGIFGLVVQAAEQRSKEVGIRKVLGASVAGIVALLSKDFIKLVIIAIVLASPLAWLSLNKWLEHYPYRTEMNWWIFVITGLSAISITILTISFQAVRAALADPVKSLRNE